ncbi:MAG: 30S ribosome-binding factor RbfA [Bacilli bacterium]|nr:30S ribosome-binding factor RbfA [Bacilli bacterium]
MQNHKLERLNNAFMEQLNIIFGTEVKNQILKSVVVTGVNITNDLSYAKVYFTCFNEDQNLVLKELKESASYLRGEVSKRVEIRHTPVLTFEYDTSLEYAKRIEAKIKEINEE